MPFSVHQQSSTLRERAFSTRKPEHGEVENGKSENGNVVSELNKLDMGMLLVDTARNGCWPKGNPEEPQKGFLPLKTPCALGKLIFYRHIAHVTPKKLRKASRFQELR